MNLFSANLNYYCTESCKEISDIQDNISNLLGENPKHITDYEELEIHEINEFNQHINNEIKLLPNHFKKDEGYIPLPDDSKLTHNDSFSCFNDHHNKVIKLNLFNESHNMNEELKNKAPKAIETQITIKTITQIDKLNSVRESIDSNHSNYDESNFNKPEFKLENNRNNLDSLFPLIPTNITNELKTSKSELRKEASDKRIRIKGRFVTTNQAFVYLGITPYEVASNKEIQEIFKQFNGYSIFTRTCKGIKIRNLQTLISKSLLSGNLPEIDPLNKLKIEIINHNPEMKLLEIKIKKTKDFTKNSPKLLSSNLDQDLVKIDLKHPSNIKNEQFENFTVKNSLFNITRTEIVDSPLEHLHHHKPIK